MKIEKYQGCGNDFLITNELCTNFSSLTKRLCNRHLSFGADGLIYIDEENYLVRFFNSDGSEATLCGNGLRCVGLYLFKKGLLKDHIQIETIKNKYDLIVDNINPFILRVIFPLNKIKETKKDIKFNNKMYSFVLIDVGNKHAICLDNNVEINKYIAKSLSKKMHDINVNFVHIINRKKIRVLTYERGAGFTLSCGSGSFASAFVLYNRSLIDEIVEVEVEEGFLKVDLNNFSISGSAKYVYSGDDNEQF